MSDVTDELILEHLKRIQDRLTRLEDGQDVMKADLRSIKGHIAAFMASEAAQDTAVAQLTKRVDRIEARLDLRDQ